MQINCIICSDLFVNGSEIFTTSCGHIFHHACLIQWLERSKTCPQCRVKNSERTIHRVYFNFASTEGIEDDKATLAFKLDNMQFQITVKDVEIKNLNERTEKAEFRAKGLVAEVRKLEREMRDKESAIYAYKEQLGYYKNKTKDMSKLSEEVNKYKERLKTVEDLQTVLSGTEEEAYETLRHNKDPESLALILATLKKQVIEVDRMKKKLHSALKRREDELHHAQAELLRLRTENKALREDIDKHKNCDSEKKYFKYQISKLNKKLQAVSGYYTNEKDAIKDSQTRDEFKDKSASANVKDRYSYKSPLEDYEEPVVENVPDELASTPLPEKKRKSIFNSTSILDNTKYESPPVHERVKMALDSDSPYLPVKTSSIGISGLLTKGGLVAGAQQQKKPPPMKFTTSLSWKSSQISKVPKSDMVFDGMGGYTREEKFPSPQKNELKRTKTSMSSTKFRKLAPHKTLHDYVRKD